MASEKDSSSALHRAAYANFAIQNADCIIAVGVQLFEARSSSGSRFDDRTTGIVAKYAPKAPDCALNGCACSVQARAAEKDGTGGIIHVNIDKSTFGKVAWQRPSKHLNKWLRSYNPRLRCGRIPSMR